MAPPEPGRFRIFPPYDVNPHDAPLPNRPRPRYRSRPRFALGYGSARTRALPHLPTVCREPYDAPLPNRRPNPRARKLETRAPTIVVIFPPGY